MLLLCIGENFFLPHRRRVTFVVYSADNHLQSLLALGVLLLGGEEHDVAYVIVEAVDAAENDNRNAGAVGTAVVASKGVFLAQLAVVDGFLQVLPSVFVAVAAGVADDGSLLVHHFGAYLKQLVGLKGVFLVVVARNLLLRSLTHRHPLSPRCGRGRNLDGRRRRCRWS